MKIVCISDTHRSYLGLTVPKADILLFSGDMDTHYSEHNLLSFCLWLDNQPVKHKVIVAGNHDFYIERNNYLARQMMKDHCIYLENSEVEINGFKIWGSPWTLRFYDWAFMTTEDRLKRYWEAIPDDTNILVTHEPPHGIMDLTYRDNYPINVGSTTLLERVKQLKDLKLHLFGHIHPSYGQKKIGETLFVNGSVVDDMNEKVNDPIIIDL